MPEKKICPLMSNKIVTACREDCAWFVDNECVIVNLWWIYPLGKRAQNKMEG